MRCLVVGIRINREKSSKWSGENNGESEKKGDLERKGTVESNSLKKGAKKHCYHGMLWKGVWKPGNMKFC